MRSLILYSSPQKAEKIEKNQDEDAALSANWVVAVNFVSADISAHALLYPTAASTSGRSEKYKPRELLPADDTWPRIKQAGPRACVRLTKGGASFCFICLSFFCNPDKPEARSMLSFFFKSILLILCGKI